MACDDLEVPQQQWNSTTMSLLDGALSLVTDPCRPGAAISGCCPPRRSATMQFLDSLLTPGTVPNTVGSFAVMVLVMPRVPVPFRLTATAAGMASGLIFRE
ncbi:hypothetical protein ABH15_04595 [Methanoculleus taiwanensis]|uniref:Uncharacterized protein n=1 Tax=Methanoculleus taiwanensis TaxID=1550565 RepID=A0A498H2S0_9EURY|nr:hypothetical protein [Methanoculleus taiwanensis]RXE57369.1 hypothetical protein ABH15_04595 [Methanoculleus taiwanensis]